MTARRSKRPQIEAHNAAQKLSAAERRAEALEYRKAGASLRDIATRMGVSHQAVKNYLDDAVAQLVKDQNHSAEELRAVELDRLDRLQLAIWPNATGKDVSPDVRNAAIDRLVRIADRRAKLLGLDMPTKMDVAVSGNVRMTYSQLVAEVAEVDDDADPSA